MKALNIKEKANFVGRQRELEKLRIISQANEAGIIILYGRRRVGKTELLEQAFRNRNILKFEGIDEALAGRPYFDAVITLDQLFDSRYW